MTDPLEEAENCRCKALVYCGQPEASFLLRVADELERLGRECRRKTAPPPSRARLHVE